MIADNWLGLLLFFLLAAPGLLYDLREDRHRATAKESAFREAGRTALASVLLGAAALPVTLILALAFPDVFATPAEMIRAAAGTLQVDPMRLAASLAAQVGAGRGIALLTQWVRRRNSTTDIVPASLWTLALRTKLKRGSVPLVRVRLKNGEIWSGVVEAFSADLEVADRELVIGPPLARIANRKRQEMPAEWVRVVISGPEIEYMTVQYVTLEAT